MDVITRFGGPNAYLSNFAPSRLEISGIWYPTAEHAFQAAKVTDPGVRKMIAGQLTPKGAKLAGRQVQLRPDWESAKKRVMLMVVLAKFTQHPDLAARLAATEDARLVEGNFWHDNYWGSCWCGKCAHGAPVAELWMNRGLNYLGRTLMAVRDVVRVD